MRAPTWSNKLAAGNAGWTLQLTIERHCPGVPEPGRSATWARWFDGETF